MAGKKKQPGKGDYRAVHKDGTPNRSIQPDTPAPKGKRSSGAGIRNAMTPPYRKGGKGGSC